MKIPHEGMLTFIVALAFVALYAIYLIYFAQLWRSIYG